MHEQSLVKRTLRLNDADYLLLMAKLQRRQVPRLVRTFMACLTKKIMAGEINDIILFIAQRKPLTLDPRKEKTPK